MGEGWSAKGEVQSLGCCSQGLKRDYKFGFCLWFAHLLVLFTVRPRLPHKTNWLETWNTDMTGYDKEAGQLQLTITLV